MSIDTRFLFKFFSPRLVAKAVATLDKSTAIVVGVCWIAALVTLGAALYAVHGAVSAKRDADAALVAEPVLPAAQTTPLNDAEIATTLDRLKRQFPDLKFEAGANQSIIVKSNDGGRFHEWITALGYVDSMSPQFHWMLNDFCVGKCPGSDLMKATVAGERVTYTLPQKK
jgi:hypothetical protein